MIPALKRFLLSIKPDVRSEDVSLIKLHNGYSYTNPKVSFVAFASGQPFLFLKTVRHANKNSIVTLAYESLTRAEKELSSSARLPHAEWCKDVDGIFVFAESIIAGRPLDIRSQKELQQAFDWLFGCTQKLASSSQWFEDLSVFYQKIRAGLRVQDQAVLKEMDQWFAAVYDQEIRVPRIPSHGDCTASNMLLGDRGRLGIIDWDRYGAIEMPLFDLLTFLDRVALPGRTPVKMYQAEIDRHMSILGIENKALPLLIFFYAILTEWRKRTMYSIDTSLFDERFQKNLRLVRAWTSSI